MNHTESLDSRVSLLGNARGFFSPQKCHPSGLGKRAIACLKDEKATTTVALQALHCLVTLAEGTQDSYLQLTIIILAISCLAAEIYQHRSTMLDR